MLTQKWRLSVSIFHRYCVPDVVIADNKPKFIRYEFLAVKRKIKQEKSHYQPSKCLVENKRQAMQNTELDSYLHLILLRNNANDGSLSPVLFSEKQKAKLPTLLEVMSELLGACR